MKTILLPLLALVLMFGACKKEAEPQLDADGNPVTTSDSFFPLAIGNYWIISNTDYSKVTDTLRIGGKLYYKVESLIGGDGMATRYLRIDGGNLYQADPRTPAQVLTMAKFGADTGDQFKTTGDNTYADLDISVIDKAERKMVFQISYHAPGNTFNPVNITYYKGIGPFELKYYTSMKIDGVVYSLTKK